MTSTNTLAEFSEQQLLRHFGNLVRQDRRHTAELLLVIAEIDQRKLWAKQACPSMFAFCVERFHMSESVAAKRIWAARTARRFRVILQMVARGELHLSAIVKLAKHLTEQNHRAVLLRAKHKSSREIDLLVAELAPRADVPSRIRALPRVAGNGVRTEVKSTDAGAPPHTGPGRATSAERPQGAPRQSTDASAPPCTEPAAPPQTSTSPCSEQGSAENCPRSDVGSTRGSSSTRGPDGRVVPLAPRRYKIEITVDEPTHDKLRMLQDLLGHQLASTDPAAIVSRTIDLLLRDTLKKKAAITDHVRDHDRHGEKRSTRRARAIPAAIRRAVWQRDGGHCTFVDRKGRRCPSTRWIEYHHERPYGKGGQHEAGNITLRCRAHNQYQADLDFGQVFMRDKRRGNSLHSPGNA